MEAVIFVGIPASGKTMFYLRHFFRTHVRINRDMLKTRHREQILIQACIAAKQKFVSDNTNRTPEVRARVITPAKAAGFKIIGYYFQSSLQEAIQRNAQRPLEEQIPEKGIGRAYQELILPAYEEGFDTLYYVKIVANGEFSVAA